MLRQTTACVFLIAACAFLACPVEAGIAVSPLQQQVVVKPGGEAEFALTVENVVRTTHAAPTSVRVEVVDFSVSRDGALSFGEGNEHARSAVKWIELDAGEFVLDPGESRKVRGRIRAPFGADGDYWAAVLMTIVGPKRESGVNVVLRTASGVFVRVVRRNHVARAGISGVRVALPHFEGNPTSHAAAEGHGDQQGSSALMLQADVKNKGIISFIASGRAIVYLDGRRRMATIPLHAGRRRILPGHMRRFTGVLPSPLPEGQYKVRFMFQPNPKGSPSTFQEAAFQVERDLARHWEQNNEAEQPRGLQAEPQEVAQVVGAGRFTAGGVTVVNRSNATMAVHCSLVKGRLPPGWAELYPTDFTLAPLMRRSVLCRFRIPIDAEPGQYDATIIVRAEGARLVERAGLEPLEIPVLIKVNR